jgi:hypothetical protein
MAMVSDGRQWVASMLVCGVRVGGGWRRPTTGWERQTRRAPFPPYQPIRNASTWNLGAVVDTYRRTRSPAAALTRSAQPWIASGAPTRVIRQPAVPGRRFSTATWVRAGAARVGALTALGGVGAAGSAGRSWERATSSVPAAARAAKVAATVVAAMRWWVATVTSSDLESAGPFLQERGGLYVRARLVEEIARVSRR